MLEDSRTTLKDTLELVPSEHLARVLEYPPVMWTWATRCDSEQKRCLLGQLQNSRRTTSEGGYTSIRDQFGWEDLRLKDKDVSALISVFDGTASYHSNRFPELVHEVKGLIREILQERGEL